MTLKGQSHEMGNVDLSRRSIENVIPSAIQEEYPLFIEFIKGYFEYLDSDEGFGDLITKLKNITDPDLVAPTYLEALKQQYGTGFPETSAINERLLIRIFEYWYRSKGTEDAIRAYFRFFLNTEAEVVYPKDNMFIIDGGNWDDTLNRYKNQNSHIDEATAVFQDDYFYQQFAYLVKTGISIKDWGPTYKKLAHMAGWIFFGKVQIESLAQFEYQTYSPTIVPGFGVKDSRLIILATAAYAMGVSPQRLLKIIADIYVETTDTYSLYDVKKNFLLSTYTPNDVGNYTIENIMFANRSQLLSARRPAHIIIT